MCAGIRRDDGPYLAHLIMAYILTGQSRETCMPILLKSFKQGGLVPAIETRRSSTEQGGVTLFCHLSKNKCYFSCRKNLWTIFLDLF